MYRKRFPSFHYTRVDDKQQPRKATYVTIFETSYSISDASTMKINLKEHLQGLAFGGFDRDAHIWDQLPLRLQIGKSEQLNVSVPVKEGFYTSPTMPDQMRQELRKGAKRKLNKTKWEAFKCRLTPTVPRLTLGPLSQHEARKGDRIVLKVEIGLRRHWHPFVVGCSCPSGSTEHERLVIRIIGPGYDVYAQRTPGAGGLPSEMITIAIAIIRYISGTSDDPKAAPQAREMTKHRSKPRLIEGLTMEIKREERGRGSRR